MKIRTSLIGPALAAGLVLGGGAATAATGYVGTERDAIARTGYGECVHTQRWSEQTAIAECDPEIVAARERAAAAAAAMEVVSVQTAYKPIHLQAKVLFDFDSAELSSAGKARLDDLLGSLTARTLKDEKVVVTGYTDRIGSDDYNRRLSQRRAAVVRDYLVARGLVPAYIETRGLGPADPQVDCPGLRGAALIACLAPNRRTEVDIAASEAVEGGDGPAGSGQ
ncbi:MAG TPA: OmpA family protein [Gammaproteobacteria bacterium]|nr:OmpA family protein [Gammaproteobacteria bacterium]